MDVLGYRITPQIHASDDATIVENLAGQTATVLSARALAPGLPVAAGPVTLRGLFNPVAGDPERAAQVSPEAAADPRQETAFAAAWTVGSLVALSAAGVASILSTESPVPAGFSRGQVGLVMVAPGRRPFPVFHVLANVASRGRSLTRLDVAGSAVGGIAAIAVQSTGQARVLVANLTPERRPRDCVCLGLMSLSACSMP